MKVDHCHHAYQRDRESNLYEVFLQYFACIINIDQFIFKENYGTYLQVIFLDPSLYVHLLNIVFFIPEIVLQSRFILTSNFYRFRE